MPELPKRIARLSVKADLDLIHQGFIGVEG